MGDHMNSNNKRKKYKKKFKNMVRDARRFNSDIDYFITNTQKFRELPPVRINRGDIRRMTENDQRYASHKKRVYHEYQYQLAKKTYEKNIHNIMEEIIETKRRLKC